MSSSTQPEVKPGRVVELVGGPCCGLGLRWPSADDAREIEYHAGRAIYQLEPPKRRSFLLVQRQTAKYVRG